MTKPPAPTQTPPQTREERLAAKLRENLHRRKAQARAHSDKAQPAESPPATPQD